MEGSLQVFFGVLHILYSKNIFEEQGELFLGVGGIPEAKMGGRFFPVLVCFQDSGLGNSGLGRPVGTLRAGHFSERAIVCGG